MSKRDEFEEWQEMISDAQLFLKGDYAERNEATGLLERKYIEANKELEDRCRLSLARILMTGDASSDMQEGLAQLLAPDGSDIAGDRKFILKRRSRARQTDYLRNSQIVRRVKARVDGGSTVENAIAAVAKEVNLTEETVKNLWQRYKPFRDHGVF